jgi:hypothetical protein
MPQLLDVPRSSTHAYDTRRKRNPIPLALNTTAFQPLLTTSDLCHQSHYVDWTNYVNSTDTNNQVYYYSFKQNAYLVFDSFDPPPPDYHTSSTADSPIHEGYRANRDNVPKSFAKAVLDPKWGDPARSELHTIVEENNAIVRIDPELARQHIRDGAEYLYMHPVYKEKLKEGKVVTKVHLVINGRNHTKHGNTYSPTPSRKEFLILLHIIAILDSTTGISTKSAHS